MNNYIMVKKQRIQKGNFSFVYDATNDENLYEAFFVAESRFKISYIDFCNKLRTAFEEFVLFEEAKRRLEVSIENDIVVVKNEIKDDIIGKNTDYKKLLTGLLEWKNIDCTDVLMRFFNRNERWAEPNRYKNALKEYLNMSIHYVAKILMQKEICLQMSFYQIEKTALEFYHHFIR